VAFGARWVFNQVWQWIYNELFVTFSVDGRDELFFWLNRWLINPKNAKESRVSNFRAATERTALNNVYNDDRNESDSPERRWKILYIADEGGYHFSWRGAIVWVSVSKKRKSIMFPTVSVSTWAWNKKVLQDLIDAAVADARQVSNNIVTLYRTERYHPSFVCAKQYAPNDFCHPKLPILPKGQLQSVLDDVRLFLNSREFYHRMGVPYRRGYLLYGPPGSGKTTLIRRVAAEFRMSVCIVNLGVVASNEGDFLPQLLCSAPPSSLLLLEDVDVAFPKDGAKLNREEGGLNDGEEKRKNDAEGGQEAASKLTLSALFNALDGVGAQEGSILMMTTNHPDRLDPALIRCGRIDFKIEFASVCGAQAEEAYLRFFPSERDLASQFARSVDDFNRQCAAERADTKLKGLRVRPWSMADVQERLVRCRFDPVKAAGPVEARFVEEEEDNAEQEDIKSASEEKQVTPTVHEAVVPLKSLEQPHADNPAAEPRTALLSVTDTAVSACESA